MKKLFIGALVAASVFTSAYAAGSNKVSDKAIRTFHYEFKNASNVEWTAKSNFAKAAFTINGIKTEAFFDVDGSLIGTSRTITMDQLPTSAKRAFGKRYADYAVVETIKFDDNENTSYYISAANEKETVILKVDDGSVSVFKRTKK